MPNTIIIPAADIGDVADASTFDLANAIASSASTVTKLTNGTSYRAFVLSAASDAFAPSASSSAPAQVTGLGVTPGDGQNALAWSAPADGGSPITDYVIEVSTNGGASWSTLADGTSTIAAYTHAGLTNGTTYTYRVAAVNGIGTGPASASVSGTPVAAGGRSVTAFDSAGSPSDAASYTFPDVSVAAGSVVVGVFGRPTATVTALTVGGVSATKLGEAAGTHKASMWIAEGVTGSTATVAVTFGASTGRCGIAVWSVSGDPTAADCTYAAGIGDTSATSQSATIDVADGGLLLAYHTNNTSGSGGVTWSWTGVGERMEATEVESQIWHGAADQAVSADETGRAVEVTFTSGQTLNLLQLVSIAAEA